MSRRFVLSLLAGLALLTSPAEAQRKPLVVGTNGQPQQLQQTDTLLVGDITTPVEFAKCDTTGATSATSCVQGVLDRYNGGKGGTVSFRGILLLSTSLTLPPGVTLKGQCEMPGSPGTNPSAPYGSYTCGVIRLASTATINMSGGSTLANAFVFRAGMTFPAPNASAFAGTAVTAAGDDVSLQRVLIAGFNRAFYSSGYQRARIEYLYADNVSGVEITDAADIPRIAHSHFWPFATIATPGPVTNHIRSGTAIYLHDSVDWAHITDTFSFGYSRGIRLVNVNSTNITGGGADNAYSGGPLHSGSIGLSIEGTSKDTMVSGFQAAAQAQAGVYQNISAGFASTITSPVVWGGSSHGIQVDGGDMQVTSGLFGGSVGITNGVTINNSASRVGVSATQFKTITSGRNIYFTQPNTLYTGTPFVASATASKVRDVSDKLRDTVSVLDFPGCDPTGVADSTACFQAAANSGAKTITVPAGAYKWSAQITIPALACPKWDGAGLSATRVFQTGATDSGFVFSNSPSQHMCGGGGVSNMTIQGSTSPFTSYSTGAAIKVYGGGYLSLTDLHIEGWQTGIAFHNTHNTFNGRISMQFLHGAGIEIGSDDSYGAPSGNTWDGIVIGNTGATFDITPSTGMTIYQSGGDFIRNVDFAGMGYGMTITPRPGKQVAYIWLDSALFDTSLQDGLFVRAQAGSYIYSINAVNSWFAFNSGFGLFTEAVGTGILDGFRCTTCRFRQNVKAGAVFNPGSKRVSIQNSEVSNNGRTTTPGTWAGISVGPGVSYFHITGNTIGNFAPEGANTQGTSIQIQAGASDHYVVSQNICYAPAGGASCIVDGGTGVDKSVTANVGP